MEMGNHNGTTDTQTWDTTEKLVLYIEPVRIRTRGVKECDIVKTGGLAHLDHGDTITNIFDISITYNALYYLIHYTDETNTVHSYLCY